RLRHSYPTRRSSDLHEIDGLRHLITELRPAALDDLGLEAALQALARRAQAVDGLDVRTEIELGPATAPSGNGAGEHSTSTAWARSEEHTSELQSRRD